MTGGPTELRLSLNTTAGTDGEDVSIVCTVGGEGTLTGTWVLKFYDPDGTDHTSGVSCSITDADAREVTGLIVGENLTPGVYRWGIRRTDAGARVWSAWGTLVVSNLNRV